jgi:hypothetical protein
MLSVSSHPAQILNAVEGKYTDAYPGYGTAVTSTGVDVQEAYVSSPL